MAVVQISLIDSLITAKKSHQNQRPVTRKKNKHLCGPKEKTTPTAACPIYSSWLYAPHPRGVILEPRNLISHYKRQDRFHPTVLIAGADHLCLLGSKTFSSSSPFNSNHVLSSPARCQHPAVRAVSVKSAGVPRREMGELCESCSSLCLSNLDADPQLELKSHLGIVMSRAACSYFLCLCEAFPGSWQ